MRGFAAGCAALLGAAFTFCHAAPAAASGAITVPPVAYTERTLANGLQFIAVRSSTSPTVSVQVWYHVGAQDDPPGRSGFAHLFEHMMFKGTKFMRAEQFDRLTEDVGGSNNAFTSDDVTAYHAVVPSNHLETLLWAEAERMANLNVDEASFTAERAVVEEEFRERVLASPYGRLGNALAPSSYLIHPYKRPSIGSIEDLEAASLADVAAFHRTHYRPDNATLVVAGDFDAKQLDAWVDKYFAAVVRPAAPVVHVSATEPAWQSDRSAAVTGPQVPLPAVAMTWLAPPVASPDAPALQIASALLSGGESSRMNQALVYRRQIASSASFDADLRTGPGLLVASAVVASGRSLDQVKAALLAEIRRLATQPIPLAELAKVKTQLLTAALLSRQTPTGLGMAIASAAVLEGGAAQVNAGIGALQRVTPAQVAQALKRYVLNAHKVTITYRQEAASPTAQGAPLK